MTYDFEARIQSGYNIPFIGMFPNNWKIATVPPISNSKTPPIRMSRRMLVQLLPESEGGGGGVAVEDSMSKLGSVSDISDRWQHLLFLQTQ